MNLATGVEVVARLLPRTTRPSHAAVLAVPDPNSIAVLGDAGSAAPDLRAVAGAIGEGGEGGGGDDDGKYCRWTQHSPSLFCVFFSASSASSPSLAFVSEGRGGATEIYENVLAVGPDLLMLAGQSGENIE